MSSTIHKVNVRCDLCSVRRPGLLWLGGNDWVECPQCIDGKLPIVEQQIQPRGKVFIYGSTRGATLFHPEHAKRFG